MGTRHRIGFAVAGWALLAGILAGCSGDDSVAPVTPTLATAPLGPITAATVPSGASTSTSTAQTTGATRPTPLPTTLPPPVSIAPTPVPTEAVGVPGGASDTPMCQDYARVVGTQSVLTIAGAFGGLAPDALARLELISAPAVLAAAEALDDEWPEELRSEQATVERAVVGPIRAARADRASTALSAAGLDPVPLQGLWLDVLATYDPAAPAVTVPELDAATESALGAAATEHAAAEVRYDLDPTVLRSAATPLTTAYLFERCPELSYLIAGDAD